MSHHYSFKIVEVVVSESAQRMGTLSTRGALQFHDIAIATKQKFTIDFKKLWIDGKIALFILPRDLNLQSHNLCDRRTGARIGCWLVGSHRWIIIVAHNVCAAEDSFHRAVIVLDESFQLKSSVIVTLFLLLETCLPVFLPPRNPRRGGHCSVS